MMMKIANTAARVIHLLSRILAVGSLFGMMAVMLLVVYDVSLRNLGMRSLAGLVEYVEVALILTVFLALAETERRRSHVSVELLAARLTGLSYSIVRIFAGVSAALVAVLLAWASWMVLENSLVTGEYKLGLVSIPMWPARAAVFVGFLVLALEQIVTAVEDVSDKGDPGESEPTLLSQGTL